MQQMNIHRASKIFNVYLEDVVFFVEQIVQSMNDLDLIDCSGKMGEISSSLVKFQNILSLPKSANR